MVSDYNKREAKNLICFPFSFTIKQIIGFAIYFSINFENNIHRYQVKPRIMHWKIYSEINLLQIRRFANLSSVLHKSTLADAQSVLTTLIAPLYACGAIATFHFGHEPLRMARTTSFSIAMLCFSKLSR